MSVYQNSRVELEHSLPIPNEARLNIVNDYRLWEVAVRSQISRIVSLDMLAICFQSSVVAREQCLWTLFVRGYEMRMIKGCRASDMGFIYKI